MSVGAAARAILALAVLAAGGAASAAEPAYDSIWSRVTLEVPVLTRHIPHRDDLNNGDWGAFVDVAVNRHWSVVAGDFENSFHKNTAFAAVSYTPTHFDLGKVRISPDGMVGLDLNGGYKGNSSVDPLMAAVQIKIGAADASGPGLMRRLGLALTFIPPSLQKGGAMPVNLALTYRFGG
jgi:hypothetical protein